MGTYTPNLNLYKPDASDDFGDFRQEFNNNMDKLDNGGGGGSGGHTILDGDGNALPQEDDLQFTGAVSVTDDNVNGRTVVNISGGSNLILDAQIYTDTEKVVGVWRDKKPLYQKTVNFGSLPANNSSKTVAHGISDIETLANAVFVVQSSTQFRTLPNVSRGNTANQTVWYMTATDIGVLTGSSADVGSAYSGYVTIWYTKTTDTAGSGGYEAYGFSPVIYSDVERCIGVWRDNKPLYQRTFTYDTAQAYGSVVFSTGLTDVDEVASFEGVASYASGGVNNKWLPFVFSNDSNGAGTSNAILKINSFIKTTGEIYAYIGADYQSTYAINRIRITLRYTKTTDVAGSGDYNTLGVPTVHYSTSEQVVGTWIDGKPIYERTWDFSGSPVMLLYADWVNSGISAGENIKAIMSAELKYGSVILASVEVGVNVDGYPVGFQKLDNLNTRGVSYCTLRYTKTTD